MTITYNIEVYPEDTPIRGNAIASGCDKTDKIVEDEIIADFNAGNTWAWCAVRVTACVAGITGKDYLGGCSYTNQEQFEQSDYEDMKKIAYDNLVEKLRRICELTIRENAGIRKDV